MAQHEMEREAKFDVDDGFEMPALGRVVDTSTLKLVGDYWDTPGLRLLRWGHTLRHRRASDGSENGWTLKLGGPDGRSDAGSSAVDREELDEPGPPDSPPARLTSLVQAVVRDAPLDPIATIEEEREVHVVAADKGGPGRVEVSDDRVASSVEGAPGPEFRQIEVEVKGARSAKLLADVSSRLLRAGATPTPASKLETVVGRRPDPEVVVPPVRRGSDLEVLACHVFAQALVTLIQADPKIRSGWDAEAVHDARVATRRTRSDLKTLEPALRSVARLRDELAWVGRLLGDVRDLDVLIERVEERARDLPESDRVEVGSIVDALTQEQRHRRGRLLKGLGSPRYLGFLDDLIEAARRPPLKPGWGGRRARPFLRKATRKAWRRTARAVDRLDAAPSDASLHEIRKRAKRARYAAELGRDAFGKPAKRFADRLAELQDGLGELQDTVAAEELLRSLRLSGQRAFVAGVLTSRERDARDEARDRWPRLWKAAKKPSLRRWLEP
jgi:CHAD domain-containing protein